MFELDCGCGNSSDLPWWGSCHICLKKVCSECHAHFVIQGEWKRSCKFCCSFELPDNSLEECPLAMAPEWWGKHYWKNYNDTRGKEVNV